MFRGDACLRLRLLLDHLINVLHSVLPVCLCTYFSPLQLGPFTKAWNCFLTLFGIVGAIVGTYGAVSHPGSGV